LVIFGGTGLGKTHIAQAIGNEVRRLHSNKAVLYVSAEKFINQFIDHSKSGEVNDFILNNGVIVVRTTTGNVTSSFVAFNSACPHAGANVTFIKNSNSFNCSAHGSNFTISGSVINGPAGNALEKKTIEIVGDNLNVK
jgi:Rieske Fe-S protein